VVSTSHRVVGGDHANRIPLDVCGASVSDRSTA
jgi:hypothetical protein